VSLQIAAYSQDQEPELLALSMRAWAPVFEKLQPAVQGYVYDAFSRKIGRSGKPPT
jgi:hypothetical protein